MRKGGRRIRAVGCGGAFNDRADGRTLRSWEKRGMEGERGRGLKPRWRLSIGTAAAGRSWVDRSPRALGDTGAPVRTLALSVLVIGVPTLA